jgi:hypothetical protein
MAEAAPFAVGDLCECVYTGSWFPATVLSINPADATAVVEFLGYMNQETAALSELRRPPHAQTIASEALVAGALCEAFYCPSSSWHEAVVEEGVDGGHFMIRFVEEGNKEVLPASYLRPTAQQQQQQQQQNPPPPPPLQGAEASLLVPTESSLAPAAPGPAVVSGGAAAGIVEAPPPPPAPPQPPVPAPTFSASSSYSSSSSSSAPANIPSEFVIPEHLRLLPTDDDEQRERKRKKVKKLKLAFKGQVSEAERRQKQNTWQSFQSKGSKRSRGGAMKAPKQSMFASSDNVEAKVGVTGSGQGLTDFETRKRHNFAR